MSLPYQACITGFREMFSRVTEGCTQAPPIGAHHSCAFGCKVERGIATRAAAGVNVVGMTISRACPRIDQNDLRGLSV
jgi:hypothetical protein